VQYIALQVFTPSWQTIRFHFYDALARLTNTTLFNSTNAALDYIG